MVDLLVQQDILALQYIRGLVDVSSSFQVILLRILADAEVFIFASILIVFWLYGTVTGQTEPKKSTLNAFYSVIVAIGVYVIINQYFPVRPRPESVTSILPLVAHLPDNSFPSGHGIFFGASLAASLFFFPKWISSVIALFGTLMIVSRVAIGVHYPLDVIVGALLGAKIASLTALVLRHYASHIFVQKMIHIPLRIAAYFRL